MSQAPELEDPVEESVLIDGEDDQVEEHDHNGDFQEYENDADEPFSRQGKVGLTTP